MAKLVADSLTERKVSVELNQLEIDTIRLALMDVVGKLDNVSHTLSVPILESYKRTELQEFFRRVSLEEE
jgi:hypothetical protein